MKYVLMILAVGLLACGNKQVVLQKPPILSLTLMGDLATVEYTVTKIIKASDDKTWYKIGDRKILMSCEAYIKAGVNLESLNENSFTINDKYIAVRLPLPQIISINIPPDKIKVEYQQIGLFRDPFKSGERNALALQAEQQLRNSLPSLGILSQAKANTALFVSNFLKQAGYENISITWFNPPQNNNQ